jgi:hypothetical protein
MHQTFANKFWHDKHGNVVIMQRPNIPAIVWIVTFALTIILPDSSFERLLSALSELAVVIWAVMELGWGSNYFRRLLGLSVLLLIIVARFII